MPHVVTASEELCWDLHVCSGFSSSSCNVKTDVH